MIKIQSRYCWLIAYIFWAILILSNINIWNTVFTILTNEFSKTLSTNTLTILSFICIPLPALIVYVSLVGVLKKYNLLTPVKISSIIFGLISLTLVIMPSFLVFSCIAHESNCM